MSPIRSPTTILHVDNLHCPSCAAEIRACFKLLDIADVNDPDIDLQISLESQTVSFRNVNVAAVTKLLEDAGFNVSIPSTIPSSRWKTFINTFGHRKASREARHKQTCLACRGETSQESVLDKPVSPPSHQELCQSTFALEGLTCSSCVGTLTSLLDPSTCDGIKSSQVKLLPPMAVIVHDSNVMTAHDIQNVISDAGYGAELLESQPIQSEHPKSYKVSFAIDGMTCVSCVNSVTHAMESVPSVPVKSPSVNLLGKSGSVIVESQEHAEIIRQEIEDAGFDCTIIETVELEEEGNSNKKQQRIVSLQFNEPIDRQRFAGALKPLGFQVTYVIDRSVVKLTYTPNPPTDTLRAIVDALHLEYQPGTFKPCPPSDLIPSDSSGSHRILLLFLITLAFAIPMFIVSVIGMSLLPESNKFRIKLERNAWGEAMLGTIIMWILATPVQIGVGAYFWKGAWKSIRNVWKRGAKTARMTWFARFFMWGSMDTLVAFGTTIGYIASLVLLGLQVAGQTGAIGSVGRMGWFDSSVFLMVFILLGRYIDHITKQKTTSMLSALSSCVPDTGLLLPAENSTGANDTPIPTPAAFLEKSDVILIPAGSSPPLDCTLITPSSTTSDSGIPSSNFGSLLETRASPLAHFTEAALTGESTPVPKYAGDIIYAGTINAGPGAVFGKVECVEGERMVDSIIGMITGRKSTASMVQKISGGIGRIAEKITAVFVPIIVGVACAVFVGWCWRGIPSSLGGNGDQDAGGRILFALQFAVAVLVVACPCGIGLAAPTAQIVGIGIGARHGIISNGGGEAFTALGNLDTVVLDKTGTITGGKFTVANHAVLLSRSVDFSEEPQMTAEFRLILAIVRAAEFTSTHPVAIGVRDWCDMKLKSESRDVTPSIEVVSSNEIPGRGLTARLRESSAGAEFEVAIGNERLMDDVQSEVSPQTRDRLGSWKRKGQSVVLLSVKLLSGTCDLLPSSSSVVDQTGKKFKVIGLFGVHDPPRPEASLFISELAKLRVDVWMISGDNEVTAKAIAQSVGIDSTRVIAGALPGDKQNWVSKLQNGEIISNNSTPVDFSEKPESNIVARRRVVAFVGDGINDAPALAQADIGFAMGSGSSLALSTASFTILRSNLLSLLTIHDLAGSTRHKILSNFAWACIYNIVLIPLAAGAFYGVGGHKVTLPPVWASAAMALSSVSVVLNSLSLRWTYREPAVVRKWSEDRVGLCA